MNVAENPNLWDEYDSCIPVVFAVLRKGLAEEKIYDVLAKLEQDLGCQASPGRTEEAVKSLLALNVRTRYKPFAANEMALTKQGYEALCLSDDLKRIL